MKVRIKRFDRSLPLPRYQSKGAACVDLCARVETVIPPGSIGYIPLNVAVEIPQGYWLLLAARGSTHKSGLLPAHGIGIGDWDFCGDNDEYHFPVYNFTAVPVVVERGQRVAQMLVLPYEIMEIEEVEVMRAADRGKFGSTGKK
jgi:dUTP pyrophosphatase